MKTKLLNSMRVLLVAAALCGGASAWADDITSIPATYDYTTQTAVDDNVITPFDCGTVKAGTNVKALTISSQTATAFFDSDTEADGRQAYTLASNEKVTFTINAYHGYVNGNKTSVISIVNSDGTVLASYTYDVTNCTISNVSIGGSTASTFSTAFGFRSYYNANRSANGIASSSYAYLATESYNPVITITIYGSGDVLLNFVRAQGNINNTFSGTLGSGVKKDLAKITVVDNAGNTDRSYHIGKLSIATETLSNVTVTTQYLDGEGNKVFADKEDVISYGASFTPTYTSSASTTLWDYAYASGADELANVTSDKIVTILYNRTAKSAYSAYNILYGQDYDLSVTTADWTTATGGRFTPTILEEDGNRYLSVVQDSRGQNSTTLTSTVTQSKVAAGTDFTMTFDVKLGATNTDLPTFTIFDAANTNAILTMQTTAKNGTKWKLNNDENWIVDLAGTTTNTIITSLTWYSVKVTRSGSKTFLSIKKKSDGSDILVFATIPTLSETGGIGKMTFGTGRYNGNFAMDNVIIRDVIASEDLPTFTLLADEAQHLTFHNAGSGSANDDNWKMNVYNAGSKVGEVRADWWDDVAAGNGNFTNPYLYSADGGITTGANVWTSFLSNMKDADCDFTVSYTSGSLYIIGTMTKGNDVYYVNYKKTGLTGDVSIVLYGKNATLTNFATEDAEVSTSWVGPSNAITGTLPSSGYGSLASAYGLDFANATGITAAYVVTNTTTEAVTLTSVDELPANSGVILKGAPSATYSIPVKADAAYEGTNLLSAAVTATPIEANTAYILQNGQFHLVTAASTVPAGKAYLLKDNVPSAARALAFAFEDGETTGINNVNVNHNDDWYDLQGRRVDAPKKGLYIVNGTKVIIK